MTCESCGSNLRGDARICLACGEPVRTRVAPADRLQAAPAGVPHWIAFDAPATTTPLAYPASRVQRIFAGAVDAMILAIPVALLLLATGGSAARVDDGGGVTFDWLWSGILLGLSAGYFIGFPASAWQATPGKRLLGLRIVTLEHEQLTLLQSVARWFAQQVVFAVVVPLAMMVALFGVIAVPIAILILCGDGRSPWDRMAGTMVVD